MEMTDEMLDRIDRLAELTATGPEREQTVRDLTEMIDYVNQISEVDTTGVVPLIQPFEENEAPLREDAVSVTETGESWQKNVPSMRDGMVVTPRTIG